MTGGPASDAVPSAELVLAHAGQLVTARAGGGGGMSAGGASDAGGARGAGGAGGARGARGASGADLEALEVIQDGAVAIADGQVVEVGASADLIGRHAGAEVVDVEGRLVTPGFVDCHVHLVHGGSRHAEYDRKIRGLPPTGEPTGIAATMAHTAATSDDQLRRRALADLDVMLAHGTTTTEAKTGYGGGAAGELRLLRLTRELTHAVTVVPTFLGAHALPPERADDPDGFVDEIIAAMPAARAHARFFDVFCDPLGFDLGRAERLLAAAIAAGFQLKVHADQTADVGATGLAAGMRAVSIDHADYASPDAIDALVDAGTVAVLLPGVAHHLGELTPDLTGAVAKPQLPEQAARLVDAGAVVALSTDYNPGTSPTRSMQTVLQLAVRMFRLPAAAVWHMATINAAHALDVADERGSLEPGKAADIVVWDVEDHQMVTNRFGTNLVHAVYKDGRAVVALRSA